MTLPTKKMVITCPQCKHTWSEHRATIAIRAALRAIVKPKSTADPKEKIKALEMLGMIDGLWVVKRKKSVGDPSRRGLASTFGNPTVPVLDSETEVDEMDELYKKAIPESSVEP